MPTQLRVRIREALRASSVFGALSDALLAELSDAMSWRQVGSGEMVLREGEPADCTVFLISGALRASRRGAQGQLLLYNQVYPGQSIGELCMILQQPRAQDVIALRDSTIALLTLAAYEALLQRHPLELSRTFMKAVYERLHQGSEAGESGHRSHSLVLLPLHDEAHLPELARQLALALAECLDMAAERIALLSWDARAQRQLLNGEPLPVHELAELQDRHELQIYLASPEDGAWTRFAFRQADQLVYVAACGSASGPGELERQLALEPGYPYKRKHLVLLHPPQQGEPCAPEPWQAGRELERVYPLRRGRAGDIGRLARFLTGQAVGIVLGGGGARGFAHLGVLRALREAGIPVDLIGGNSMGALIGAQLACDTELDQILEQTRRFASGGERPTLPLVSLVSGMRVRRDLHKLFGEREITRLWRPYFAAACNLSRGTTAVLDHGPLWRAVLASNSPAGLLPPVLLDGELLVDGAILDNVPVAPMRARLGTPLERRRGNGRIIAVDVDVRDELRAAPELARLTPMSTLRHKFGLATGRRAPVSPSIAEILYSAGHVGGASQRGRTMAQADLYLEPPVAEFAMMAYGKGADIVEVGYRYAVERIEAWDRSSSSPG
ncbi:MAG: cyclic nucleotide-binding and patatin-like phospholipase domain-containing protein [Burkholderiaceae bacterium]